MAMVSAGQGQRQDTGWRPANASSSGRVTENRMASASAAAGRRLSPSAGGGAKASARHGVAATVACHRSGKPPTSHQVLASGVDSASARCSACSRSTSVLRLITPIWISRIALPSADLRAEVAVGGDLDLLVALEFQVAHRMRLAVVRIDQVPGAFEVAPADRRRIRVLHLVQRARASLGRGCATGERDAGTAAASSPIFQHPHRGIVRWHRASHPNLWRWRRNAPGIAAATATVGQRARRRRVRCAARPRSRSVARKSSQSASGGQSRLGVEVGEQRREVTHLAVGDEHIGGACRPPAAAASPRPTPPASSATPGCRRTRSPCR